MEILKEEKNNEDSKFIFELLVENENDLEGMIGYIHYKFEKKDFVNSLKNERDFSVDPALENYQRNKCTEITKFRNKGKEVVKKFLKQTEEDVSKKANEVLTMLNKREKEVKEKEKKLKKREEHCKVKTVWWETLLVGVGINVAWTALVVTIVKGAGINIIDFFTK